MCKNRWPIDFESAKSFDPCNGWPEHKKFALILTHDVDTKKGYGNCLSLMEVEKDLGFQSSFNFVPERSYSLSPELRILLQDNGFEVGVHDLKHDGQLFRSEKSFVKGAKQINQYIQDWGCKGFRAGAMHCNLDWIHLLNIEYDASTFDTDPFEPRPVNIKTIFPFWVKPNERGSGYVELPYTLPQDFTLFVVMQETDISIWKEKVDWIAKKGGMVLLNTHPDYMNFSGEPLGNEEYPIRYYTELLEYLESRYRDQYWHVLPYEMAEFWKTNVLSNQDSP